jgi:hypothetical protein
MNLLGTLIWTGKLNHWHLILLWGLVAKKKIIDIDKIDISNELNYWVDSERPSNHEELLDKTPRFCEYPLN